MLVRLFANTDLDISDKFERQEDKISLLEAPMWGSRPVSMCNYGDEVFVLEGKPGRAGIIYLFVETAKGIRGWISDHYLNNPESDEN